MADWEHIVEAIAAATGTPFQLERAAAVGGGCINQAYRLEGEGGPYFVKLNSADGLEMFEAEAEGLQAMADTRSVRVPGPVCFGLVGGQAYLALEYLALGRERDEAMSRFGRALARMHRAGAERFGWHRANTIGSTPQLNAWSAEWQAFWREQRLGFQLELAARQGYGGVLQRKGQELLAALPAVLGDHAPSPSLLHGDLWSGNYAVTEEGEPVIFDPAVYYGDREADLAMTELFGSFAPSFYVAYREEWPLTAGYERRRTLYNLYHILNHLNLFGGGYGAQAERMIDRLLAEAR